MAPFPESESMTIKRLEVALRKDDMRLLKDGAYKLHEKFHMGHKFEFLTELNQILEYVKKNNIPEYINQNCYTAKTNKCSEDARVIGGENISIFA